MRSLTVIIPLALSAFTHLWNPIGFPYFVGDEGHYIRRALFVLEQLDPQETARYDHPYFGQLFLAGVFKIIGYPDMLNPKSGDVYSTQMLYMIPRLLMGVLAVFDTFIIYKICDRRYNRTIAFIASLLFAVMPLTWFTRRIYLDSIQLPFILLSILFAVYFSTANRNLQYPSYLSRRSLLLIAFSGISLGIGIFTKIPVISLIPLIGYLIYRANNSSAQNLKVLGLWVVPVILIPAIWPLYSILVDDFDDWYSGVFSQAERVGSGIGSIAILFKIDPVLVTLGLAGLVFFSAIKRDLFLILWFIPFFVFITLVPWTQHFHWIQTFPAFCIASAVLIDDIANRLGKKKIAMQNRIDGYSSSEENTSESKKGTFSNGLGQLYTYLRYNIKVVIIVAIIAIFGLISTIMLITTNVNYSFFELVTFLNQYLPDYKENPYIKKDIGLCIWCTGPNNNNDDGDSMNKNEDYDKGKKVTVVGNHWIYGAFWIPKYVFDKDHDFKGFYTKGSVDTEKAVLVIDRRFLDALSADSPEKHIEELQNLNSTSSSVAKFSEKRPYFDDNIYPYTSMEENNGIGRVEVRAN
jgi:Dolichyl-phosphate-mannose-protein mannosyltransferase